MQNDSDQRREPEASGPRYAPHASHTPAQRAAVERAGARYAPYPLHPVLDDARPDAGDAAAGGAGSRLEHSTLIDRAADRVLAIQRPLVLAHLGRLRAKHPQASPAALERILQTRYLAAVTGGGAAVGATAAVPGVGTAAALALTSAETVGFLEATALYAQSLAELHGVTFTDPDRARVLVLTLLLGEEGLVLLKQVTGQARGGQARPAFWGQIVSSAIPKQMLGPLVDRLKAMFVKQAAKVGGASVIGKALPYGIGAVIGGVGNHVLARRVVARSRTAFGPAPHLLPVELVRALDASPRASADGRDRRPSRRARKERKALTRTASEDAPRDVR